MTPWWSIMTQKSLRRVSHAASTKALAMLKPSSAQYTCRRGTLRKCRVGFRSLGWGKVAVEERFHFGFDVNDRCRSRDSVTKSGKAMQPLLSEVVTL